MQELVHKDIWKPPLGTTAIVIPVSGEVKDNARMSKGYAAVAKKKWPPIARAVGFFTLKVGNRPHVLTFQTEDGEIGMHGGKNVRLLYHILTFPTRIKDNYPIDEELCSRSARTLKNFVDDPKFPLLNEGNIIMPQLRDAKADWSKLKIYVEPYLTDDRFVMITGQGLYT